MQDMTNELGSGVVVVGGGTMGSGIAQAFLQAGYPVTLVEIDQAGAQRAAERVQEGIARHRARTPDSGDGAPPPFAAVTSLPTGTPLLVVESVYEDYDTKKQVLTTAASRFPRTLIATNTSGLSIDSLAEAVPEPGRFVGMHFFNPVPKSTLVEIVQGAQTSADTVTQTQTYVKRLGKESILVRDSPGFATSRLGIAIGLEAMRMVEESVASCEDIDSGMRLGYRFPMGPLELSDLVGLDVRLRIAEHLETELGPRFAPPEILRAKVAAGELGVKTGRGFYRWDGRRKV